MRRNEVGDALARRQTGSGNAAVPGQSRAEFFEELARNERVETARLVREAILDPRPAKTEEGS